jgi:predicted DNA-binding protein (MmcQ/YjbR family)
LFDRDGYSHIFPMNIEEFRDYCLEKIGVTEDMPFGEDTLVFKVGGKIFALTNINSFTSINLKCDPEKAVELRDQFGFIRPGYHMNKKHWNTVLLDNSLSNAMLKELIDHSYGLVYAGLPKLVRLKVLGDHYDARTQS